MPTVAELILKKIPMPTALGSTDIRTQIAAEIRRRAFFSARMTSMTYIKMLQNICAAFAEGRINAADARLHCREALAQVGIFPGGAKGLADPAGRRRLELILKTQKKMATSVARINEDRLHPTRAALFPAWRLERYGSRSMPREDWAQRWKAAGDAVAWQGACRDRMVALKSSPIWAALGNGAGGFTDTLGNPYPPFAYSSGLDWTDVSEEEALRLGLQPDGGPLPGVSLAPSDREILMAMKSTGLSAEQLLPPEGAVMNRKRKRECQAKNPATCKFCHPEAAKIAEGHRFRCSIAVADKLLNAGFSVRSCDKRNVRFDRFVRDHYMKGDRRKDNIPKPENLELLSIAVCAVMHGEAHMKFARGTTPDYLNPPKGAQIVYTLPFGGRIMKVFVYADSGKVSGWHLA